MIIFTNGCYDILHIGHIELFKYCKSFGGKVIVAINSDESIKEIKGNDRPINKLSDRTQMLSAIRYIDEVQTFNTNEELEEIIKNVKPDIMIVGSDHKNKKVIGSEFAKKLLFFERIDEYSTTEIVQRISNR